MEKLIDDIIELVIGDMDCHHEVDHEEDGTHLSVEYNLNNETELRGKIMALLKKPQVTEEWIEEKARALMEMSLYYNRGFKGYSILLLPAKDFIHSLVEEIK